MLLDIGRAADAKRYVEEALAADPDNTALRILLVRCLIAADQERVALPVVDRLVAESPEWDYLYRLRAIVLTGLGKSAEATRAARRAVALGAEDAWNYYQLAVVLNNAAGRALSGSETKAKKQEAARKAAERAVALQPEEPAFHRIIGFLYTEPEYRDIRERAWRKTLELDPEDTTAMTELARDEAMRSLRSSGLRTMRRALQIDPQRAPNVRLVVATALHRALLLPLVLTVPSGSTTIILAVDWLPETWWSRALPVGFSAASLLLLTEALLRVRSSLRAMFARTVKLVGWFVGWIVVASALPILWLVTRHPAVMVGVALVLIPGVGLVAGLAWIGIKWVLKLCQGSLSDKPGPRWDAYLDNQLGSMGNPPRKSQTPQQRKIRSRIWMIFIVGFVLVRAVACVASGAHHNPLPATNNSHVSAGDYARQLQIGRCAQATGDRVWSPITITDCADPRAVFRVATLSTPTCPNAAYYQYLSGGSAFSTPCLAKNLQEAMCYQWPGYGSGRTLDLSAKNVPCGDPRAHLKVEKRVDGQGPLVCPPSQTMETFPVPAPGVAYCLSDPNP